MRTHSAAVTLPGGKSSVLEDKVDRILSQLPDLTQLLQERQDFVEGLSTLEMKVDRLLYALTPHTPVRLQTEWRRNDTQQMLEKLKQLVGLHQPSGGANQDQELRQENHQLREEKEQAEEQLHRARLENTKLSHRLALVVSGSGNSSSLMVDEAGVEDSSASQYGLQMEEMMHENQELLEINRKTRDEKRRLEERLAVMEDVNQMTEGNRSRLETENREKEKRISDIEGEKRQIEVKNRIMAEELGRCERNVTELVKRPAAMRDCAELYCYGVRKDGVYTIAPFRSRHLVTVWCDMTSEGGGWTVFVRRLRVGRHEVFNRDWIDYRRGFGRPWQEHWLGLEAVHHLTTTPHHLRMSATDLHGEHRAALWLSFSVASERSEYELSVGGYDRSESSLGDSMVAHHNLNGRKFSTRDVDNDDLESGNCVRDFSLGGGWWYRRCSYLSPTGPHAGYGRHMMSLWTPGNLTWVSLNQLAMMVRPASFPAC
ncbi:hypothetical protein Pcinc_008626 [Petrolisthes cinctipes]|uniref:Fibrinogen C-terminal domain-containing protein n=1 Tax=Petrolisthes cinctipes TaxID=88211 RepID=A0AAE1KVM7_PETCI|nr:hypothetical protein Pcinc_008626 [Petrolisthes cinctipes]